MKAIAVLLLCLVVAVSAQVRIDSVVITNETSPGMCPSAGTLAAARAQTRSTIQGLFDSATCGGLGWIPVATLDMSDPSQMCPPPWVETADPQRSCFFPGNSGCVGPRFPTFGLTYTRICGRMRGYGVNTPDAFFGTDETIDGAYTDGVSLTYGTPRQHIWTFGAGHGARFGVQNIRCPCGNTNRNVAPLPPAFVGDNYFCDTLDNTAPLWDGDGCMGDGASCCMFNNPPYFNVTLPTPTSEPLEARICADQRGGDENVHVSFIEIFVQ